MSIAVRFSAAVLCSACNMERISYHLLFVLSAGSTELSAGRGLSDVWSLMSDCCLSADIPFVWGVVVITGLGERFRSGTKTFLDSFSSGDDSVLFALVAALPSISLSVLPLFLSE